MSDERAHALSHILGARMVSSRSSGASLSDIIAGGKGWRHRSDLSDYEKHELMVLEMQIEDLGLGGEVPTAGRLRDDGPPDWSA